MSVAESPEKSLPTQRKRDDTPMQEIGQNTPAGGTPLGGEMAKRGILRPSGTPGSGNGGDLLLLIKSYHHAEAV